MSLTYCVYCGEAVFVQGQCIRCKEGLKDKRSTRAKTTVLLGLLAFGTSCQLTDDSSTVQSVSQSEAEDIKIQAKEDPQTEKQKNTASSSVQNNDSNKVALENIDLSAQSKWISVTYPEDQGHSEDDVKEMEVSLSQPSFTQQIRELKKKYDGVDGFVLSSFAVQLLIEDGSVSEASLLKVVPPAEKGASKAFTDAILAQMKS